MPQQELRAESEVGFGGAGWFYANPTWLAPARKWALQKVFGGAVLAPYFKGG
jgi:hypothetical protein